MKIRTGRRNPHTLYLQLGDDPDDGDLPLGFAVNGQAAAELAGMATLGMAAAAQSGHPAETHHFGLPARVTR